VIFANVQLLFQTALTDLVVRAFACEAWQTGFYSQLGHNKDVNVVSVIAQRVKKQSVDYTSAKEKLIQSWCYETLTVKSA